MILTSLVLDVLEGDGVASGESITSDFIFLINALYFFFYDELQPTNMNA